MTATFGDADAGAGGERRAVTLPLNGRDTRVGVVRLWDDSIDDAFRGAVADAFASVWPNRGGECSSIRRGLYGPERKPVPLVLVPLDGPNARELVLGYTIIYPSSTVKDGDGVEVSNCTINSVLVPAQLRGLHLGQALVKLAVHTAVREMHFKCVTAWCQPEKMPFYESCGFVYEPPKRKTAPTGSLSKGRKEALWAKLLGQESAEDGEARGDEDSSSDSGDDDGLDECMRLFASENGGGDLPPL